MKSMLLHCTVHSFNVDVTLERLALKTMYSAVLAKTSSWPTAK
jgi:hypothetical protein